MGVSTDGGDGPGWVLWAGTMGLESPLLDRFPAATEGGYQFLSVSPLDVSRWVESGGSVGDVRRRAEDAGVGLIMDPVMNWHPSPGPSRSRFARFGIDEVLEMSSALEVVSMSAIAATPCEIPIDELGGLFGALCDRAGEFGALVHLEFIPMTAIGDVASAWRIVDGAARPNGGILVDSWHFFRGSADIEALRSVPGERILAVQLDDALAEVGPDLWADTQNRLLPGDGCFDLRGLTEVLNSIGGLTMVGPEVISPITAAMSAVDAAVLAGQKSRGLVDAALSERGSR